MRKTTTRLEAPDGGWGYLVCLGMAMPFTLGMGPLSSFGLIFGDFIKEIGADSSAVAFVTGTYFSILSFAGLLTNMLYKKYSLRQVGLLGGTMYFIGSIMQIFIQSTFHLLVAYSLVQGLGLGMIVPTAYTCVNNYFVKRRVVMMSFTQTIVGVGVMLYPIMVQFLNERYGFRGCLMVLAAVNSHAILGMLIMQPVKWHMKRVTVIHEEEPITDEKQIEENERNEPLLNGHAGSRTSLTSEMNKKLSSRKASIISLGILDGVVDLDDEKANEPKDKKKTSVWRSFADLMDLSLLEDPIFVNIVIGIAFALYADITFFSMQPLYLFELRYTKLETSNIIAIGAAADMMSRIFLSFGAMCITVPSRHVYLAGATLTVIARFVFLQVYDFTSMAIITAILGFLRSWNHTPTALVFAEFLPKEKFAAGYGLFMFLRGNISFIVGPIISYIREKTRDYVLLFYCLNLLTSLCAIPWIIEIVYLKLRRKNTSQAIQEKA